MDNFSFSQNQHQKQQLSQKISQQQIRALEILQMDNATLYEEVQKIINENPTVEIKNKKQNNSSNDSFTYKTQKNSDVFHKMMENQQDNTETLQEHLIFQLRSIKNITFDEYELSEKLIFNLDKNGFYGSMISPLSLLNKKRPLQTPKLLEKCINRIQKMDPVGICCKNPEESLLIQAKIKENPKAPKLALFILDGNLELLNPPEVSKILKKLIEYRIAYHKKKFAQKIVLDEIELSEKSVKKSLDFILSLNPHPALGYLSSSNEFSKPNVILTIEKKNGKILNDDFSRGLVKGKNDFYFQVKYSSGFIPEIKINENIVIEEKEKQKLISQAKEFINFLEFRQSTIVFQGCAIVKFQQDFFEKGIGHLKVLSRRKIASFLGIHDSTVSRMTSKKNPKFIQTQWGTFPASYFFTSGISTTNKEEKISSEKIKIEIEKIIKQNKIQMSDQKLTDLLNEKGIKIARRTVAKYRNQIGLKNSYYR